ncbi:hypothetical protein [Micromonospora sp. NBC_01638]|nr:hypothetical protein OG811_29710 [Micromonospora sp. NBC_01638]
MSDHRRHPDIQEAEWITPDSDVEIIVQMAKVGPDGPTGGNFDRNGPIPW